MEIIQQLQRNSHLWASARAGFMLEVQQQRADGEITYEQVTAFMHDVLRRLDEDAQDTDPQARESIRRLARELGGITD